METPEIILLAVLLVAVGIFVYAAVFFERKPKKNYPRAYREEDKPNWPKTFHP